MKKYFGDKELLAFTENIIMFNRNIDMFPENVGLPIGNYTSQYFANIYMNRLDIYVKQVLGIKYYVRYMDDFILCLRNKEESKMIKVKIEDFLKKELRLELNDKSRYYPSKMGVDFCGYRIWETHSLIRNGCKKRMKKKVKGFNKAYEKGKLDINMAMQSINSFRGHISHASSYLLENKIIRLANFIYTDKVAEMLDNSLVEYILENNK